MATDNWQSMTLLEYAKPKLKAEKFRNLNLWYQALGDLPDWRLIRRNFDRECARRDIDQVILDSFLEELASTSNFTNPCACIDSAMHSSPVHFFLPGKKLPDPGVRLYRYMRLDHFFEYNTPFATRSGARQVKLVSSGRITGQGMEDMLLGKRGSPVWVTDDSLRGETDSIVVRDRLGLRHIESNFIVELSYPMSWLESEGRALHAPTVLDACAGVVEKTWIFIKRGDPGGPDWGYALDMTRREGGRGPREAVHAPTVVAEGRGHNIEIRVLEGPIQGTAGMDYEGILNNKEL